MTSGPRTLRVAAAVLILSSAPLRARDEGAARYMGLRDSSLARAGCFATVWWFKARST